MPSRGRARPIVLLTDFGSRDPFVGVMKCVIEGVAPGTLVIDLVHDLKAHDVRAGAVALAASLPFLPPRAVVVAVVDPGVGGERRAVAVRSEGRVFVAPDNGLLDLVPRGPRERAEVRVLENRRWFLPVVSSTFHGRDVFAPVAARLSAGARFAEVGPRIDSIVALGVEKAVRRGGGCDGEVLAVDRFGNAVTNVPGAWVGEGDRVLARGRPVATVARTYSAVPVGRAVAMVGSMGTLEVAVHQGDAARRFRLRPGLRVRVEARRR